MTIQKSAKLFLVTKRMIPFSTTDVCQNTVHETTRNTACTWVEQNNSAQAAEFRLVHQHLAHLRHQFCEDAVEYRTDADLVSRVTVHVQSCRQHDAVPRRHRLMGEASYQQLIPTWHNTQMP